MGGERERGEGRLLQGLGGEEVVALVLDVVSWCQKNDDVSFSLSPRLRL